MRNKGQSLRNSDLELGGKGELVRFSPQEGTEGRSPGIPPILFLRYAQSLQSRVSHRQPVGFNREINTGGTVLNKPIL